MREKGFHLDDHLKGQKALYSLITRYTLKDNPIFTHFRSTIHKKHKEHLRIEDPLWERVCREVVDLMGHAGQPIRQCKPGYISHRKGVIALDCQSEKALHFARQFDFIILGSLKPYFPILKAVKARRTKSL